MRSYWAVSPNVRNKESTVQDWIDASIQNRAAFMGWPKERPSGHRFAHKITHGDVILIARRSKSKPQIVGLGVVRGKHISGETQRTIKSIKTPDTFRIARKLSPFISLSEAPERIHLIDVLRHTAALVKLHPNKSDKPAHILVCKWMDELLARKWKLNSDNKPPTIVNDERGALIKDLRRNPQLDYNIYSKEHVVKAEKKEADLLRPYRLWLERKGRKLDTIKCGNLECDGFEEKRRNLIEAKSSTRREYIRMAVGQLLDYSFQSRNFGRLNMGILLPKRPDRHSVGWLKPWKINLIWREKKEFLDNDNGNFT